MKTRCFIVALVLGLIISATFQATASAREGEPGIEGAASSPATICDTVTEIPKTECQALVTLYQNTNGPGWVHKDGWLMTNASCSWWGVHCFGGHVDSIFMDTNNLKGSFPVSIGNLPMLESLSLGHNSLAGSIPSSIGNNANLRWLQLGDNQFSGSLPASMSNLVKLEDVSLIHNKFSGSIPSGIEKLTNLKAFTANGNMLSGGIPGAFGNLTRLTFLDLGHNQFGGGIPTSLGNLSNLEHLNLGANQLTGTIPSQIGKLGNLRLLLLGGNQLTGELPPELGNLTKLDWLHVGGTNLTGAIPSVLRNLSLNLFYFGGTGLCEPPDAAFQAWLASIPNLERTGVLCGSGYSIAGNISLNGFAVAGVSVSDGAGHTVTTNTAGQYSFTGLSGRSYTITPSKSGYSFTPTSRTVTVPPNATNVDFTASENSYSISGKIVLNGITFAGVSVSDGAGHTVTTNTAGQYQFTGLGAKSYTITPSKSGYSFTPASRTVTVPPNATNVDFTASENTYSISGKISLNGFAVAGASVSDGAGHTVTTNSAGQYQFTGLSGRSYTVTPSKSGHSFTPTSRTVTVPPNATNVDFTAAENAFSVSGRVLLNGITLAGVDVSDGMGHADKTNAAGEYRLTGLRQGGYTITPSLDGYRFTPASRTVTVPPDQTNVDFAAEEDRSSISGKIVANGITLVGVAVSDGAGQTVFTNLAGEYRLTGLPGRSYTVTPSMEGYVFTPATRTVTVPPNATNIDFTAAEDRYSISGKIVANGITLVGVAVSDGAGQTVYTNLAGEYRLTGLRHGSYTVTPNLNEYVFTPASRTVTVPPDQTNIDFAAAEDRFSISGKIVANGITLVGVAVSDGAGQTVFTNLAGEYRLTGLRQGSYTITPSTEDYAFTPASRTVTVPPDQTNIDFAAAEDRSSISGKIVANGITLVGVAVSDGAGQTVFTNMAGEYRLTGLRQGSYTITPSMEDYVFTPASRTVTVPPNAMGQDFVGTLEPDLSIQHVEVNQGVQDRSNSVKFVAGKRTVVRVYVGIDDRHNSVNGVSGKLVVRQDDKVVLTLWSNNRFTAKPAPSPELMGDTLNFSIDGSYLSGQTEFEITVNPGQSILETNYDNNTATVYEDFAPRRHVRVRYVPIHYAPFGYTGPRDPGDRIERADEFLKLIYPIGANDLEYLPLPQSITWTWPINWPGSADSLLSKLADMQESCDCDYIYGWLPANVFDGNGMGMRPGSAAFGNDTDDKWRRTLAHELGHNLGANHTTGQRGDPNAPDTLTADSEYGINVITGEVKYRRPDGGLLRDVMYAGQPEANAWVTPYFWDLAYRAFSASSWAASAQREYLVISGTALLAGGGSLRPMLRIIRDSGTSLAGGAYCIRQEDLEGQALGEDCFDVDFVGDEGVLLDTMPFHVAVPWQVNTTRVKLMHGASVLDEQRVSANAPTVTVSTSGSGVDAGDPVRVTWSGADPDADSLTYELLYSGDGGVSWLPVTGLITDTTYLLDRSGLPGGDQSLVRVRVTDGVNTSQADSALFSVNRKAPSALIYTPLAETLLLPGEDIILTGRGWDPEDGTLPDAALIWSSDKDGNLGSGASRSVTLTPGVHNIVLKVTDSDDNTATESIRVYVGEKVFSPIQLQGNGR